MSTGDLISVEVAYARPERQQIIKIDVAAGTTLREAVERSGILERFPEIDLASAKVGIWSKPRTLDEAVSDGDRIEIYRPLIADPKEARRRRAQKKSGAGDQPD